MDFLKKIISLLFKKRQETKPVRMEDEREKEFFKATEEEFKKWLLNNPQQLPQEYLSQIRLELSEADQYNDGAIEVRYTIHGLGYQENGEENSCYFQPKEPEKMLAKKFYHDVYFSHDPMQDDHKIRDIMKEADQKVLNNLKDVPEQLGRCHMFWAEKKKILKQDYGIDWKTPAERCPGARFD